MLATCHTRLQGDLKAQSIAVEVHLQSGLPGVHLIGLPETAVRESRDRVRSALLQSGFSMPSRRLTINLAPADLPKFGTHYDLAIAIGILLASNQLVAEVKGIEFYGELGLSGALRSVKGLLPALTRGQDKILIVPEQGQDEFSIIEDADIRVAKHLVEVVKYLRGELQLDPPKENDVTKTVIQKPAVGWQDVRGQILARRAMVRAACGGHSMLMFGPPGCGKTLLAQTLPGILPILSQKDRLEVASIHSISQYEDALLSREDVPFRQPHHSSSAVALIGGGSWPRPGEISLAHKGVLFLDELTEFRREALEALREPLERGAISISRAHGKTVFPAQCQLIAAMNPCPCGYLGEERCSCSEERVSRYRNKLSGPLLDRIDMHVEMHPLQTKQLVHMSASKYSSQQMRQYVEKMQEVQYRRQGKLNAHLTVEDIDLYIVTGDQEKQFLELVIDRLKLSARAYHRILRLARTIADTCDRELVNKSDISQASAYRQLDRTA